MRAIAAAALLVLAAAPALAQTDAERADALRAAAESLRAAIETLEKAAATLEGAAGGEAGQTGQTGQTNEAGQAAAGDAGAGEQQAAAGQGGELTFLDPLSDTPLDIPDSDVSDAVMQFHQTGEVPYVGDEQAAAEGKKLYDKLCAACHLKDGTGRIGPNLIDDTWKYPRAGTDKGKFEVIYAGGAGAMQAFSKRISQDEILKVIAYLHALAKG